MNTAEVVDHAVQPVGNINPDVPPLTEKENVFNTIPSDSKSLSSGEGRNLDEKHGVYVGETDEVDTQVHSETDPFVPFNDLPDEPKRIITVRAVVMGLICGALVNASNIYLGLKTGWTFSANLFGAILGFAVIKFFSKAFAENFPILGGSFGPRENNIIQTAATASGGLSSVFISAIPALYQLKLLDTPKTDFWRLVSFTAVGGYFGFFFATPLRKFFIIYVARELHLIFPSASATAMTIRSMHLAVGGEAIAKMKMRALSIAFGLAFLLRVCSQYAIGILWDWHIFTWFFIWGHYNNAALAVENWGWMIEWTPAFIGVGMLVGLNTAVSFFGGSVLAWGISDWPCARPQQCRFGSQLAPHDPHWSGLVSFASLGTKATKKDTPSPRYWLLWPGVLCMIAVSFTELALQYKVIFFVFRAVFRGSCKGLAALYKAAGKHNKKLEEMGRQENSDMVEDSAAADELVKVWMWAPGLIVVIICVCVVMGVQYQMPIGMSLLSVFLAFFFSFLAIQCSGVTDIIPLTAASKASQIVLGGATKGSHWPVDHAQRLNLLGGAIASIGANQSSDLVGDFRVGFLLRTPPNQQWLAQGLGTIVAIFMAPAMFILFSTAYPCIIDVNAKTIVFAVFGALMVLVRHYAYTGSRAKYRAYHPNMMCVALAFVLPQTVYGTAMVMGAVPAFVWARRNPKHFDVFGYAVAAGLIAGEGIGGVVNAIFQVAGIAGPDPYGTQVGCPALSC
ncbi:hypothetical protein B0A49_01441 [Cryomyces minteri]|uniref:Oligopeptide transporter n=1 Tax=Cryomyces minteri TaxID=331657 RepID=A0A4U0XUF9_9PEZI|nr:hypothetical protein B0A49_01441 [Cryomyces minteri]